MVIRKTSKPVLVTGATGYVAGRLIPLLLDSGYRIRAMGRSVEKMRQRSWSRHPLCELVRADIMDAESLERAVKGCGTIFYLVHSMISQKEAYRDADKTGAGNMVRAAAGEKAEHIIYLGGLGDIHHQNISKHLISRHEVGDILSQGPVPVTVLRAAMILGSGSASFEILRYLAERLPVMITPKWVSMPTQPIAISNVLGYLKGCLECPETRGKTFDIGGPDVVSYRDLFRVFAGETHLPTPIMIPVPVLTPRLSSLWIHLVTPVPAAIAQPLAEGLSLPTICTENAIVRLIPQKLIGCREAIQRAMIHGPSGRGQHADAPMYPEMPGEGDAGYSGGTFIRSGYRAVAKGSVQEMWDSLFNDRVRTNGYAQGLLWDVRGWINRLAGGSGLVRKGRRGRDLQVGDRVDFFRVESVEKPQRLVLSPVMKVPGRAFLEIRLTPGREGLCNVVLVSHFMPKGLFGLAYAYLTCPFHHHAMLGFLSRIIETSGLSVWKFPRRFTL